MLMYNYSANGVAYGNMYYTEVRNYEVRPHKRYAEYSQKGGLLLSYIYEDGIQTGMRPDFCNQYAPGSLCRK